MMGEIRNKVKKTEIEATGRKAVYSGMLICIIIKPHTLRMVPNGVCRWDRQMKLSICENLVCD